MTFSDIVKSSGQIAIGATGNDVKRLQGSLNDLGFNIAVDGKFGPETQSAVKEFQRKNGLAVDGIVYTETSSALDKYLNEASGSTGTSGGTTGTSGGTTGTSGGSTGTDGGWAYNEYSPSDVVTSAQAALDAHIAAKPGEYQSKWKEQIDGIINRILNREDFSYDLNSDALYQQYKDQYTALGKMAMQDTMGQAAAMTGGYGNSYASTAGNQSYQSYLQELNNVVPELYQMALDKYTREGTELYNQYGLLSDQESQDYGRYMDSYNQWLSERDYLSGRYDSERDYDYGKYVDERNLAYDEYRNSIADDQWQKSYDESVRQYNEQMALEKEQWEYTKSENEKKASDSAKSYSGKTSSGVSYNNGTLTNSQVKDLQAVLGVSSDGYYGPESQKAAGGLSAAEAYNKYVLGKGSDSTGTTTTGGNKTSGVSDSIRTKLDGLSSNSAVESYLESLESSGVIDHETALQLMSEYMDDNEVYTENDDGSKTASYSSMIKSTKGWKVISTGGVNWFWGIDENAIVEAPDGERIRLDNLVDKLVAEGMSKSDAKSYVKALQKNLDI